MRIVTASGKGGTGKTTISTSLAEVVSQDLKVLFLDCDVEAPNAALFFKPEMEKTTEVGIPIPKVNSEVCSLCGKCAEVCQFNAIAAAGKSILIFPELCHGCGSCTLICPNKAISEIFRPTGVLESGRVSDNLAFAHGRMNIGEPMAVPIIRAMKKQHSSENMFVEILDSPPGASCPVVETLRGADYAILVTEPTPFGLHDLKQVVSIVRELKIPTGIVINRDGIGDSAVENYCAAENLNILMRIPMERRIAEGIARGSTLLSVTPEYASLFQQLWADIKAEVLQ